MAIVGPAAFVVLNHTFSGKKIGFAGGIFCCGAYLSAGLSALSGPLSSLIGWRWDFRIVGLAGLPPAIAALFYIKNTLISRHVERSPARVSPLSSREQSPKSEKSTESISRSTSLSVRAARDQLAWVVTLSHSIA